MNVMFLVNGRWFKTLCKTVLEADTFDVSISTEKHNILAHVSDKCYFTSIDNYCIGYDTIDTIKTDFFISRNFKNTKEFLSKLDDTLTTFLNTSIRDKDFYGNLDECIEKCLQDIKKTHESDTTEGPKKRKPITTDIDMIKDFTKETETAENDTATHTYEIRVFKDGAFSHSNTFSLESFAEYAFTIMELNSIDFPEPCFNVIQLFKDGKPVKRSVINFGVKVNNQTGEKWQIINKNTLDSIMKVFKCVQGNCRERIVVDGEHLVEILADIYLYLMINDLLADKKPKKIHYDFRHMYPNNCISLPESTHFTIIYNRGFFYIDLNSIKRGFCPNRKTMNFFVEVEKNG